MQLISRNHNPQKVQSLLNNFFTDEFMSWPHAQTKRNSPSVNIIESNSQYMIELAVPGFSKEDFKIELNAEQLSISGKIEKKEDAKELKYSKREFSTVDFTRNFVVPADTVNEAELVAEYNNGLLQVTLPKLEEKAAPAPKHIAVS